MIPGGTPCGVGILVVVVRHLLAVQLLGVCQPLGTNAGQSCRLVRVLAVAQRSRSGSPSATELLNKPIGHSCVVISGVQECVASELTALLQGEAAFLHGGSDIAVTSRVDDDGNRRVVLRRSANHRRASDVDLLHALVVGSARGNGLPERVQVNDNELESLHTELLQLSQVVFLAGISQNAGVNTRVQRLHTALEALRETSEILNRGHRHASCSNLASRGTGGNDFHASLVQVASQLLEPSLVVDANQSALDWFTLRVVVGHFR